MRLCSTLAEVMCIISGVNTSRLAPKLLKSSLDNKYIQKQKCHSTESKYIHKKYFSLNSAGKQEYSTLAGKKNCSATGTPNLLFFFK